MVRPFGGIEISERDMDIPMVLRRHARDKLSWAGMIMEDFQGTPGQ